MAGAQSKALKMVIAAALGSALGACAAANPINWVRDLTGASKNDDSDSGRNKENLEAAGNQPYPTIGSVPPPPETALSTIDRQKLEKGLIADRANAKYSDDEMRQGRSVPPLPGEPPPTPPEAAAAAAPPSDKAPAAPAAQTRHSPPVRGSAQAPQESSLTTPSVHALPQGEAPHAPPSAPLGVGAKAAQKPAPSAPAPAPPQQQLAMAPSPVPRDARAAPPAVMSGKGAAVTLTAAEIGFTADGSLSGDDRKRLADVAAMVKQGGGKVRIIGYGRQGRGADAVQQELESFNAALDRANAAAQALAKLGVSANQITVQVEPELVNGGLQAGRAEVLLDY